MLNIHVFSLHMYIHKESCFSAKNSGSLWVHCKAYSVRLHNKWSVIFYKIQPAITYVHNILSIPIFSVVFVCNAVTHHLVHLYTMRWVHFFCYWSKISQVGLQTFNSFNPNPVTFLVLKWASMNNFIHTVL